MKRFVFLFGVLSLLAQPCWSQESGSKTAPAYAQASQTTPAEQADTKAKANPEEAAIRGELQEYVKVFNEHEASAVCSHWTVDGVSVDVESGEQTVGRENLQKDFTEFFKQHPQSRLSGRVNNLRMIRPDVALADGQVTLLTGEGDPVESAFTAVLVKEGDRWLISNSQERDLPTPPTSYDALKELAWLVGNWQDKSDDVKVNTVVRWSPSRAFLIRAFDVQHEDGESLQGTQVIGWDPLNKQIRTWTFNSDGSFGEGFASKNSDEWMIKMSHVLSDGRVSSGTQVISRIDDDTIQVQTIGETVDGEPIPTSDPVTVVRIEKGSTEVEAAEKGDTP